jgi:hypothetical protein
MQLLNVPDARKPCIVQKNIRDRIGQDIKLNVFQRNSHYPENRNAPLIVIGSGLTLPIWQVFVPF